MTTPRPSNPSTTSPWGQDRETYRILFVCTGNTCRSPMAEAIASHLLAADYPQHSPKVRILSAGAAATPGIPTSYEAKAAIADLGISHTFASSRALTPELIDGADVIFTMSRSHERAVLEIDPSAASKVKKLDPTGCDVPDPIGQSQAVYNETAQTLNQLIAARLKELFT